MNVRLDERIQQHASSQTERSGAESVRYGVNVAATHTIREAYRLPINVARSTLLDTIKQ
jgi:hypothetical protein